jgi:hypothetical protein
MHFKIWLSSSNIKLESVKKNPLLFSKIQMIRPNSVKIPTFSKYENSNPNSNNNSVNPTKNISVENGIKFIVILN